MRLRTVIITLSLCCAWSLPARAQPAASSATIAPPSLSTLSSALTTSGGSPELATMLNHIQQQSQQGQTVQPAQNQNEQNSQNNQVSKNFASSNSLSPQVAAHAPPTPSPIEKDYGSRLNGADIHQFGYDVFSGGGASNTLTGAIADSYVLGIGDEVVITLRGQRNDSWRARVDRDGLIILPDMKPISAAGRSFGEFRQQFEAQAQAAFLQTEVFLSLGAVREMNILVGGEVQSPGMQHLSGLTTLMGALIAAGGPNKTGSLRDVKIMRGDKAISVDLYTLLLGGSTEQDTPLEDGDRIIVPPLKNTIAVMGEVIRPGIFEITGNTLTREQALKLAAGSLRPEGYRFLKIALLPEGGEKVEVLKPGMSLAASEIMVVTRATDARTQWFSVDGRVSIPGLRSLKKTPTLKQLVSDALPIRGDAYMLFGAVQTADPVTRSSHFEAINPNRIRAGLADYVLHDGDTVIFLGMDDVRYLLSQDVQAVLRSGKPQGPACGGLRVLSRKVAAESLARLNQGLRQGTLDDGMTCPDIYDRYPDLLPFVLDYVDSLEGEVQHPGLYPVLPGTSAQELIDAGGGTTRQADLKQVEVSRYESAHGTMREVVDMTDANNKVTVSPGDGVRVNPSPDVRNFGTVFVGGEVQRPGTFSIRRGERLSELLMRAGGVSPYAYSAGAVFTRESVRQDEQKTYETAARELEIAQSQALMTPSLSASNAASSTAVQEAIHTLRSATAAGRVVAELDPAQLQAHPGEDITLQPGDAIVFPGRPSHVNIAGEVLNPGAQQYQSGLTASDYIKMAGGTRETADEDRIFVVLPSGRAEPLKLSSWNFTSTAIPPGSTIIVPRDMMPINFWSGAATVTQVLSQVAISAAALVVLSKL